MLSGGEKGRHSVEAWKLVSKRGKFRGKKVYMVSLGGRAGAGDELKPDLAGFE